MMGGNGLFGGSALCTAVISCHFIGLSVDLWATGLWQNACCRQLQRKKSERKTYEVCSCSKKEGWAHSVVSFFPCLLQGDYTTTLFCCGLGCFPCFCCCCIHCTSSATKKSKNKSMTEIELLHPRQEIARDSNSGSLHCHNVSTRGSHGSQASWSTFNAPTSTQKPSLSQFPAAMVSVQSVTFIWAMCCCQDFVSISEDWRGGKGCEKKPEQLNPSAMCSISIQQRKLVSLCPVLALDLVVELWLLWRFNHVYLMCWWYCSDSWQIWAWPQHGIVRC